MRDPGRIKPQDILILMKLCVSGDELPQKDLAGSLGISPAEISYGMKRLRSAGLVGSHGVSSELALEFLIHGLKFLCPPILGPQTVGVRTSFAHPGFKFVQYKNSEIFVWPYAKGEDRGAALEPIYPSLPKACLEDKALYKLAALVEMIRSGRARERSLAMDELKKMVKGKGK